MGQSDGTVTDLPIDQPTDLYTIPGLDTSGGTSPMPGSVPAGNNVICSDGTILVGGSGTCPSGASISYTSNGQPATTGLSQSAMNSLIGGGLSIAKILALEQAPQGQVLNAATGQVSTQTAGYPIGTTALSAQIGGIPVSMWLIIGVGIFLVMGMQKR